ncbi:MAG: ribose 5-phosphate isomerase B [Dehalococcoidales bacterium]|jgi:ribose 5-phosphate isomerase B|nr:ribose 5-phosphate isomerase B [Dehalococcoidales bacterium]
MKIAIAADHGGFVLKSGLISWIESLGHQVEDLGAYIFDARDDYPDYARAVSEAIVTGKADRGIIICGSGVGAAIAANKIKGIRACLCHDTFSAHQGVEHDNMNVLCLGGRVLGIEMAKELIKAFLSATFNVNEKYIRRLDKITALENTAGKDPVD